MKRIRFRLRTVVIVLPILVAIACMLWRCGQLDFRADRIPIFPPSLVIQSDGTAVFPLPGQEAPNDFREIWSARFMNVEATWEGWDFALWWAIDWTDNDSVALPFAERFDSHPWDRRVMPALKRNLIRVQIGDKVAAFAPKVPDVPGLISRGVRAFDKLFDDTPMPPTP